MVGIFLSIGIERMVPDLSDSGGKSLYKVGIISMIAIVIRSVYFLVILKIGILKKYLCKMATLPINTESLFLELTSSSCLSFRIKLGQGLYGTCGN